MTQNAHERAQELIALAGANDKDLSQEQQTWLRSHLQDCAPCRDYADAAQQAVRVLRSQPLTADSALVQATQTRVRARALELQRRQERVWVVCVCCMAVTLGTAFTTTLLWGGFAWMGQQLRLPGPVWAIALLELSLLPAIVAGILLLARGTYLADHRGSLRE